MTDEYNVCVRCGSDATLITGDINGKAARYMVRCTGCERTNGRYLLPQDARADWNRRNSPVGHTIDELSELLNDKQSRIDQLDHIVSMMGNIRPTRGFGRPVAYRFKRVSADGTPIDGWGYKEEPSAIGLPEQALYLAQEVGGLFYSKTSPEVVNLFNRMHEYFKVNTGRLAKSTWFKIYSVRGTEIGALYVRVPLKPSQEWDICIANVSLDPQHRSREFMSSLLNVLEEDHRVKFENVHNERFAGYLHHRGYEVQHGNDYVRRARKFEP